MMKHAIHYLPSGQIVRGHGVLPTTEVAAMEGCRVLVVDERYDPNRYYVKDEQVVAYPPRPSLQHDFDFDAEAWTHNVDAEARVVRAQRDTLLAASDWTQIADAPSAKRSAWRAYRAALRDVTQQAGFPRSVAWPVPPA